MQLAQTPTTFLNPLTISNQLKKLNVMDKVFKIQMVTMPNFLTIQMPARKKEDGFKELPTIPVSQLTEAEADGYADEMKQAFLAHWANKKLEADKR